MIIAMVSSAGTLAVLISVPEIELISEARMPANTTVRQLGFVLRAG